MQSYIHYVYWGIPFKFKLALRFLEGGGLEKVVLSLPFPLSAPSAKFKSDLGRIKPPFSLRVLFKSKRPKGHSSKNRAVS